MGKEKTHSSVCLVTSRNTPLISGSANPVFLVTYYTIGLFLLSTIKTVDCFVIIINLLTLLYTIRHDVICFCRTLLFKGVLLQSRIMLSDCRNPARICFSIVFLDLPRGAFISHNTPFMIISGVRCLYPVLGIRNSTDVLK